MKNIVIGFVVGLLIGGLVVAYRMQPGPSVPGIVAQELAGKTPVLETLPVKTYPGTNKNLGVPTTEKVLTATKIAHTTAPQTITAALDQDGTTRLYISKDPLPWLGRARKHDLSVIYGRMDQETVTRLQYRLDLIQVKRLNIGLSASANMTGESRALVGVSLSYSW